MAKEYYSFDETKKVLGLDEEELKKLVSEGQLKAVRDDNQIKFLKDEIDSGKKGFPAGDETGEEPEEPMEETLLLDDEPEMPLLSSELAMEEKLQDKAETLEAIASRDTLDKLPAPEDDTERLPSDPAASGTGVEETLILEGVEEKTRNRKKIPAPVPEATLAAEDTGGEPADLMPALSPEDSEESSLGTQPQEPVRVESRTDGQQASPQEATLTEEFVFNEEDDINLSPAEETTLDFHRREKEKRAANGQEAPAEEGVGLLGESLKLLDTTKDEKSGEVVSHARKSMGAAVHEEFRESRGEVEEEPVDTLMMVLTVGLCVLMLFSGVVIMNLVQERDSAATRWLTDTLEGTLGLVPDFAGKSKNATRQEVNEHLRWRRGNT